MGVLIMRDGAKAEMYPGCGAAAFSIPECRLEGWKCDECFPACSTYVPDMDWEKEEEKIYDDQQETGKGSP